MKPELFHELIYESLNWSITIFKTKIGRCRVILNRLDHHCKISGFSGIWRNSYL